jgi:beta-carotene ketolase (CrtW type)
LKADTTINRWGWVVASSLVLLWIALLAFNLGREFSVKDPVSWLGILLQTHLFTGLFITAHDAMHGTIHSNTTINNGFGRLCLSLFALNSWRKLLPKHHQHHRHVATADDPDYGPPAFWRWYLKFLLTYVSIGQIVGMAILFQIAAIWIPENRLIAFYVIPSVVSTLQLFYFGTYLPHRGEHAADNIHKASSQAKNHVWAFLSCYFFGYHYEHHDKPNVPWWRLYQTKA